MLFFRQRACGQMDKFLSIMTEELAVLALKSCNVQISTSYKQPQLVFQTSEKSLKHLLYIECFFPTSKLKYDCTEILNLILLVSIKLLFQKQISMIAFQIRSICQVRSLAKACLNFPSATSNKQNTRLGAVFRQEYH